MTEPPNRPCTAFEGFRCIVAGALADVAVAAKAAVDRGGTVLIFDDLTGEQIDLDFRGTADDVYARLGPHAIAVVPSAMIVAENDKAPRGRGRPKLGVVAREVTLLPRHWDWLNSQPGGASVALRRLVDEARKLHADRDRIRQAQDSTYRFMSALAGNLPGFEEATRALFAGEGARFDRLLAAWPPDIRDHARKVASPIFARS